jgi:L-seryl-tRNA(Ser) seleniumtransferase
MKNKNENLRKLPAVDAILKNEQVVQLKQQHGISLVTYAVRCAIDFFREKISGGSKPPTIEQIIIKVNETVRTIAEPSLIPVVNATGIVLHTNLGRAPLGKRVLEDLTPIILGYSNLEFDLCTGRRGDRNAHCAYLLCYLTGAQSVAIVNNNAAALVLVLSTLAKKREVIISRGELIEIGGSFRIPEIMAASGCRMVEVGATNRTRIEDYEKAINDKTALIFKAHKSNYTIKGFTEEVEIKELSALCHRHGLALVYDIGSGLLRKPAGLPLASEPDVAAGIRRGADIVTFSCDKLLGGPQAGIIAGKEALVKKLSRAPLFRALRAGKLTLAALSSACRSYLSDDRLTSDNPTFSMLSTTQKRLAAKAQRFAKVLNENGIPCEVVENAGSCGGGTLPDLAVPSKAVRLTRSSVKGRDASKYAQEIYHKLLSLPRPVVGILREGKILFDVLTMSEEEIGYAAGAIKQII